MTQRDLHADLLAAVPYAERLSSSRSGEARIEVPLEQLAEAGLALRDSVGASLATMTALDDRRRSGSYRLTYVFRSRAGWFNLEAAVPADRPQFPSLTSIFPAAHWYERETQDLFGLTPEGHPDPRRLILHDHWPPGLYPLRKDFDPRLDVPRADGDKHRFHELHGEGIVEIPVGPIHAGIIEPGHFRFAAVGELVLHLETQLFYTHRGIEKLAEGKSVAGGLQIAERVCGACALSNAVAYCQAVEAIAGATIPTRAAFLRTLFLELERLYNHIGDLGNLCAGTGFAVGASQGARLKDELQQLNERSVGHRFLRGICQLGGVRRDLTAETSEDLARMLDGLEEEFRRFVDLLFATDSFVQRLDGAGVLEIEAARDLGAVGIAARASGLPYDARRDRPYAAYERFEIPIAVQSAGDVRARAQVRIDETVSSFHLAQAVLSALPAGPISVDLALLPPFETAVGITESPRGENIHWVRSGPDSTIDRYRIRSASYCNWPAVGQSVPGNMVPDFPLINKSFELCYSCLDR